MVLRFRHCHSAYFPAQAPSAADTMQTFQMALDRRGGRVEGWARLSRLSRIIDVRWVEINFHYKTMVGVEVGIWRSDSDCWMHNAGLTVQVWAQLVRTCQWLGLYRCFDQQGRQLGFTQTFCPKRNQPWLPVLVFPWLTLPEHPSIRQCLQLLLVMPRGVECYVTLSKR